MKHLKTRNHFPSSFYVANVMEIFERLAWYGFFALASIYMSTPSAQGGVEFSEMQRGAILGIIPFFLYLLPIFTGALGDRWGYRNMFLLAFAIMTPGYFLLGQADGFNEFFCAFLLVAFGAACFKPVVVGTISHCSDDNNRGVAFGIFYTMVNVGGFLGPLIAGYMRSISWDMVFLMSACWIAINFIPALFWYHDPKGLEKGKVDFSVIFFEAQQVLGNSRFAFAVFPLIIFLIIAGADWWSYQDAAVACILWFLINFVWDKLAYTQSAIWYRQKIQVSNKPFALYLLLLTGFWTVYNQLFFTLPLYIRDFVDTGDLVSGLAYFGQGTVAFFAYVDTSALAEQIANFVKLGESPAVAVEALLHQKVRVPIAEYQAFTVNARAFDPVTSDYYLNVAQTWTQQYRQVNPEYLINLNFALIIFGQIAVSLVCQKFRVVNILVVGVITFALGLLVTIWAQSAALGGITTLLAIMLMAFGEMITSPKSQEYVADLAPKNQTAMYMGYYFVSMALGFLFAGLLSGWGYGFVAKELGRPELMWLSFASLGVLTSVGLFLFNAAQVKSLKSNTQETYQKKLASKKASA